MCFQSLKGRLDQVRLRLPPLVGPELPPQRPLNGRVTCASLLSTRNRSTRASMSASTTNSTSTQSTYRRERVASASVERKNSNLKLAAKTIR